MEQTEEQLKAEYAANGVDLPELAEKQEDEKVVEKPAEISPEAPKVEPTVEKKEPEKTEEDKTLTTEPEERPKRTIYQEYKEKKLEARTEKERADQAEKERDDLKTKLDALSNAKTVEQKQDAKDDLEAFAEEIQADPQALKRMRELFTKDLQGQGLSEDDRKAIEQAKTIIAGQSKLAEQQAFEDEFRNIAPSLKSEFPNASDEEMQSIKKELDKISHTEKYHDKDLDYVVFKNKEVLSKLVSPQKRGIEGKGKKDVQIESTDFDPNADYSKMTPAQREKWEAEYSKLGKNEGLVQDAQGRKIFI
jgi:hypothetical protein